MKDIRGRTIEPGVELAYAVHSGSSLNINTMRVTSVEEPEYHTDRWVKTREWTTGGKVKGTVIVDNSGWRPEGKPPRKVTLNVWHRTVVIS